MDPNKLRKINIKSFIRDQSTVSRLQSLRLPRDLSLGGTKSSKKVFKPNLNVIRNKHKLEKTARKSDRLKPKHEKVDGKPKFIQSAGIFSGAMGGTVIPRVQEKKMYVRGSSKPESLINTNKGTSWNVNQTYEAGVLDEIIQYNNSSDSDNEGKLPFEPVKYSIPNDLKIDHSFSTLPAEYSDTKNIYSNPLLTVWKLPDSFAFKKGEEKSMQKRSDCLLNDLPEGQIGKICVRKSGKFEVYIGNSKYNLDSINFEMFSEELVALNIASQTCSVLGDVGCRFILNPDWKSLLC